MNLTEEKKAPLREKRLDEKRELLAMQFKGSIQVDVDVAVDSMCMLQSGFGIEFLDGRDM